MTKENLKAREIVIKMQFQNPALQFEQAKHCAKVAVDEILFLMKNTFDWDVETNGNIHYWLNVKEEIEFL